MMTLTELVRILKKASPTQIDPPIMKMIEEVDLKSEQAVRDMLAEVYKSGFYSLVDPFIAVMCDPKFIANYPL
jgi:hypothetical protein